MTPLPAPRTSPWLNKVPEVALSFWVIKIMSTTVGETGADFLAVIHSFPTRRSSDHRKSVV